jgi:hypothetical protein
LALRARSGTLSRCEARVFDPEEIHNKNIFPKGFYPLLHPNHPEGGIFTATRADDVAKFDSVIASDFYIYDGGVRFNGDAVMAAPYRTRNFRGKS